jgi:hypothetical protein
MLMVRIHQEVLPVPKKIFYTMTNFVYNK